MKTISRLSKALALAVVLAGCQSNPSGPQFQSFPAVQFNNPLPLDQHNRRTAGPVEVRYLAPAEFKQSLIALMGREHYTLIAGDHAKRGLPLGFAVKSPDDECHIYMERKPHDVNDAAWFYVYGHEIFHCMEPDFHKQPALRF